MYGLRLRFADIILSTIAILKTNMVFFLGPGPLSDEFVSAEILSETPGKFPQEVCRWCHLKSEIFKLSTLFHHQQSHH